MPGLKWATSEQETWLSAYYEQYYVPCKPIRNYTDFKPVFYEAWFQRWPEWAVLCKKSGLDPSLPLSKEQELELSDAIKVHKDVSTKYRSSMIPPDSLLEAAFLDAMESQQGPSK